jgi:hypothetical protein
VVELKKNGELAYKREIKEIVEGKIKNYERFYA